MNELNIKQMILQGPPGTSKTYGAKYDIILNGLPKLQNNSREDKERERLNEYMISSYDKDSNGNYIWKKNCGWDMVQFHPSYNYEDFVRGITVSTTPQGNVNYETVNKILGNICELAAHYYEIDENSKFFLIIDEINRADIATVFGELIYALENRGEEVSIPYAINGSYKLKIPNNLYIIGTMNTADKSIGAIDYAIRRRFLFFDCLPDKKVLDSANPDETKEYAKKMLDNLKIFIDTFISEHYHAKDLYIGHTYLIAEKEDKLKLKLQYQILPILREYVENGILDLSSENKQNCFLKNLGNSIDNNLKYLINYLNGSDLEDEDIVRIFKLLCSTKENQAGEN